MFELRFLKNGRLAIRNESEVVPALSALDILINMTPTGDDFVHTGCHHHLSPDCRIVDFSHPGISVPLPHEIHLGNRVRRKGLRFLKSLPGDWQSTDFPACSLASLLAAREVTLAADFDRFADLAKEHGFYVRNQPDPPGR